MDGGSFIEEGPAAAVIDKPRKERTRSFLARLNR
jgi:polar amino acid transport system ATP-binding protein